MFGLFGSCSGPATCSIAACPGPGMSLAPTHPDLRADDDSVTCMEHVDGVKTCVATQGKSGMRTTRQEEMLNVRLLRAAQDGDLDLLDQALARGAQVEVRQVE